MALIASFVQVSLMLLLSSNWELVSATHIFNTQQGHTTAKPTSTDSSTYSPEKAYKKFNEEPTPTNDTMSTDGFNLPVIKDIVVKPQEQVSLRDFGVPDVDPIAPGHYFIQDTRIDPVYGIFHPRNDGIYLLSASVIVQQQPDSRRRRRSTNSLSTVTVAVCTDNNCIKNPQISSALMSTGGLTSTETTLSVIGTLHLNTNHNVTVNIVNTSSKSLTVASRSTFMAHFMNKL